jgi:hypothetical protein
MCKLFYIAARIAVIAMAGLTLCHAQSLPDAPTPRFLSADNVVMAYDGVARLVLDPWSTRRVLGRGGAEGNLPPQIANHPATMVGYGAAVMAVEWLGARELRRHGHKRIARMIFAIDGSYDEYSVVKNFQIQRSK